MSSLNTNTSPYENIRTFYTPENIGKYNRVFKHETELKHLKSIDITGTSNEFVAFKDLSHKLDDIFLLHYSPNGDPDDILFSVPAKIVKNIPHSQKRMYFNTIKYEEKIKDYIYYDKYNFDYINSFRNYEFIDVNHFYWIYGGEFYYKWKELGTIRYHNIMSIHNNPIFGLDHKALRIFMLDPNIPDYLHLEPINTDPRPPRKSSIILSDDLILLYGESFYNVDSNLVLLNSDTINEIKYYMINYIDYDWGQNNEKIYYITKNYNAVESIEIIGIYSGGADFNNTIILDNITDEDITFNMIYNVYNITGLLYKVTFNDYRGSSYPNVIKYFMSVDGDPNKYMHVDIANQDENFISGYVTNIQTYFDYKDIITGFSINYINISDDSSKIDFNMPYPIDSIDNNFLINEFRLYPFSPIETEAFANCINLDSSMLTDESTDDEPNRVSYSIDSSFIVNLNNHLYDGNNVIIRIVHTAKNDLADIFGYELRFYSWFECIVNENADGTYTLTDFHYINGFKQTD